MKVAVKNMVCSRCIKVLREELLKHDIDFVRVDLGNIYFNRIISESEKKILIHIFEKEGLELVESRAEKIINQVKILIIENVHYGRKRPGRQNFSDFIALHIGMEYSQISKLFSLLEKRSIENYVISQRIERAKELLMYGELTLSQISYELDYSSPQHLSRQFKRVTGLTATGFKKFGKRRELDTI